jgi:hypothetical protein
MRNKSCIELELSNSINVMYLTCSIKKSNIFDDLPALVALKIMTNLPAISVTVWIPSLSGMSSYGGKSMKQCNPTSLTWLSIILPFQVRLSNVSFSFVNSEF